MIFAVLMGLQLVRDLIQAGPLTKASPEKVMTLLTPVLEQLHKAPAST